MINKIQRDLLKKHVGPFLFCFFTVMFILLMQFLILHTDKLVGKGLPFFIVIELILNNLAYMVVLAAPMAVLVATLMAFGKFSEWNELNALRAAGVNPFNLMKPVLFSAVILSIALAYFSNEILPESNHKARSLFIDIRMKKPGFDLQPGTFYDGIEGYTFLVQETESDSDTLRDITLFQAPSESRYRAYIKAEKGWLESPDEQTLTLFMKNGSILRNVPSVRRGDEILERTDFEKYRISFDLSNLAFSRSNPEQRSRNDRTMSAQAMLAVIDTLKTEKEKEYEALLARPTSKANPIRGDGPPRVFFSPNVKHDSVAAIQSEFIALNMAINPSEQQQAINQAVMNFDRYKSDLENSNANLKHKEYRIAEFMVEVHKKFSIPFACIIFVLLGAPIGMMSKKGNLGIAAVISAVILTFYFIALIQGEKWADRLFISPFWGMWGINLLYGLIGIILTIQLTTSFRFQNLWQRS
ncbi:MAG: LptF/LptG family permease [Balneolaceae bacterium]